MQRLCSSPTSMLPALTLRGRILRCCCCHRHASASGDAAPFPPSRLHREAAIRAASRTILAGNAPGIAPGPAARAVRARAPRCPRAVSGCISAFQRRDKFLEISRIPAPESHRLPRPAGRRSRNGRTGEVGGSGGRGRGGSRRSASVDGLPPLSVSPSVFLAIPERRVSSVPLRASHGGWLCAPTGGIGVVCGSVPWEPQPVTNRSPHAAGGWTNTLAAMPEAGQVAAVGAARAARRRARRRLDCSSSRAAAGCGVHAVHRTGTTQFQ